MTTRVERLRGCLRPVVVDEVVADPEQVRDIARRNGPYFMPARYLIDGGSANSASESTGVRREEVPAHLIGPVWRGDWAFGGEPLVPEAEGLLHHPGFVDAARSMYDAEVVLPEQVYVNLTAPCGGMPFSHIDIPEFVGVDRTNAPGWLLQAMGSSGLFEAERITIVTAVAWFHSGPRGFFRYWPLGRDAESVRHENMWNTAVVGDNDFMHHKVERVGADGSVRVQGLTLDTELDHDGDRWVVVDHDEVLARYDDHDIRLSVSWKAKVYADAAAFEQASSGDGELSIADVLQRFAGVLGEPLAATGADALSSPALRDQLSARWSGYRAG